jgi:coenzyme F420-reducing hydrogenase delta subunit
MFTRVSAFVFGFAEHHSGAADAIKQSADLSAQLEQIFVFDALADGIVPVVFGCQPCGFQLGECVFEAGTGADEIKAFHEQHPE